MAKAGNCAAPRYRDWAYSIAWRVVPAAMLSLAFLRCAPNMGMAMAASKPMMTTATRTSARLKPWVPLSGAVWVLCRVFVTMYPILLLCGVEVQIRAVCVVCVTCRVNYR